MSDPRFVKQEIDRFCREHAAAEGWSVHRIDFDARLMFLSQLPAFLRARAPGAFTERIVTDIAYVQPKRWTKGRKLRLTALPYKSLRNGLSEFRWNGDIELLWNDAPIHVHAFWIPANIPEEPQVVLVATKSWEALEDLYRQGLRWVKGRYRRLKSAIHVVNGPNYKRPKVGWGELILPEEMKRQIRESVEAFLAAKRQYRELGVPYRRGFLFLGPPGNGKTMVTKAITSAYKVSAVTLLLKHDIEERHVDEAFNRASTNPPCVLILEDLDKLVNATRVSLSYILNRLDGIQAPLGVLTIATTNEPGKLDPALLHRPSRFDRVWEFKLPAAEERLALLRLKGGKYFSEEALARAAATTGGFSMAYVQEAVISALMSAIHERAQPADGHLEEAVRQLRAQIKAASSDSRPINGTHAMGFGAGGR
ncbi:MAG: ATP-binding protein [Elusimicrobia bacterium]|nr:ATP-binding protein [Elusimicrobiota bacterium]